MDITKLVSENPGLAQVIKGLGTQGHHLVYGVTGSQRALLADLLSRECHAPVLLVCTNLKEAETLLADYEFFSGNKGYLFPSKPALDEADAESHVLDFQRIGALEQVVLGGPVVIAAPISALLERLPPPQSLAENQTPLSEGQSLPIQDLTSILVNLGYQRVERVDGPGQFSHRGEIVDFHPPGPDAYRVGYFDIEIESIRTFDVDSQRSLEHVKKVSLGPLRLPVLSQELRQRVVQKLGQRGQKLSPTYMATIQEDIEKFTNLHSWPGSQKYLQYMFDDTSSLTDYFAKGFTIVHETPEVLKQLELNASELLDRQQDLLESGKLLPDLQPWLPLEELLERWQRIPTLHTSLLLRTLKKFRLSGISGLSFRQVPSFYGQQQFIADEITAWVKRDTTVIVVGAGQQLAQFLKAQDIPVEFTDTRSIRTGIVNFIPGALSSGFEFTQQKLVVLSLNELTTRKRAPAKAKPTGMTTGELQTLVPGEYVVHSSHGIGQFMGIVTREIAGSRRDYLYIKYAGKDRLYLPTDQVHLLQRYLGGGEKAPKLYALGGGEWQRVKKKVRDSVQKLAFDLLALYAKRQAAKGYAFGPDTPWQRELEDSFPFQETPDQLTAIQEIKEDMESQKPMDRLLCGDVGFGKTEVALRAAMKAVVDGKQVAVLAPTTVLAQQHFRTFSERLAAFPIRVEVLSRFKTQKQQKEIVAAANAGHVDVLVGTHRLLQKDIHLPNLGLLIVDEEQRFGVEDKERIKQLKENVDILTMTATPIPRTLHMALLGIRDLSVINTPPEGRYPVQTYVMEYTDQLAVSSIRRELDRDGQVYLIYNRVQGIDALASRLRKLMPDVSIGVIHGQMSEGILEQTMLDFFEGKYQILLSTTIIENGLDIPNVNTVLVYDADRLGLSQLYQLRGRVGRGRRLAYAYFTYRKDKVLAEKAQKRLAAIKEFTELGAGYKISLRDLEIRGAGNILGPEQHGYISAVGFDLYCQLLEQQVKVMTGQETPEETGPEVVVELPISAYIPDDYMPEQEKIYVYRRIKEASGVQQIEDVAEELADRFGQMPSVVENLLNIGRTRVLAAALGVSSINWVKDSLTGTQKIKLEFLPGRAPDSRELQGIWVKHKEKFDFKAKISTEIYYKAKEQDILPELEGLLHLLSKNSS